MVKQGRTPSAFVALYGGQARGAQSETSKLRENAASFDVSRVADENGIVYAGVHGHTVLSCKQQEKQLPPSVG